MASDEKTLDSWSFLRDYQRPESHNHLEAVAFRAYMIMKTKLLGNRLPTRLECESLLTVLLLNGSKVWVRCLDSKNFMRKNAYLGMTQHMARYLLEQVSIKHGLTFH